MIGCKLQAVRTPHCPRPAQVHAAVLRGSGKEVVIKVLKPGVEDTLTTGGPGGRAGGRVGSVWAAVVQEWGVQARFRRCWLWCGVHLREQFDLGAA